MEYVEVSPENYATALPEDFENEHQSFELDTYDVDHALFKRRKKKKGGLLSRIKGTKKSRSKARKKLTRVAKKASGLTLAKRAIGTKKSRKIVRKKVGSLAARAALSPLIPLKPVMVAGLIKKGKKASLSTPLDKLTRDFYTYIVKGRNFEEVDHADMRTMAKAVYNYIKKRPKRVAKRRATRKRKGVLSRIKGTKKSRKAVRRKVGKKVKSIGTRAILSPLLPLKPVMVAGLKKKGKSASLRTPMDILVRDFYNYIVVPHSGGNFETVNFDPDIDHVAAVAITTIASAVITFIKGLKKKKASGEKLSRTEETIVSGTEQVEGHIEEKAREEAAQEVGSRILFDKKTKIIIFSVVGLLIGLVAYKAIKK